MSEIAHRSRRLFLIGIGGSGMAPLARLAIAKGWQVAGYDRALKGPTREQLFKAGVEIFEGDEEQLWQKELERCDTVGLSSAIGREHPIRRGAEEMAACRPDTIRICHRMDLLLELVANNRREFALSGTHGKTSSSSLLGWTLHALGFAPDIIVGGEPLFLPSGVAAGRGEAAVYETDESDRSFLKSNANYRLILNIDHDHLESYEGSFDKLKEAFADFMARPGVAVVNLDDASLCELAGSHIALHAAESSRGDGKKCAALYGYSIEPLTSAPLERRRVAESIPTLCATQQPGSDQLTIDLDSSLFDQPTIDRARLVAMRATIALEHLPGLHFAANALGVVTLLYAALSRDADFAPLSPELNGLDLPEQLSELTTALNRFPGVSRRLEKIGSINGAPLYDDYGHHPTEIAAVLRALRLYTKGKLRVIFQPHRYSRTEAHHTAFAAELAACDQLYLMSIYSSGESPRPGVTTQLIADSLPAEWSGEVSLGSDEELIEQLFAAAAPGDVLLSLGAGSISALVRSAFSLRFNPR